MPLNEYRKDDKYEGIAELIRHLWRLGFTRHFCCQAAILGSADNTERRYTSHASCPPPKSAKL